MAEDANVRRATQQRHSALVGLIRDGVTGVDVLSERFGVSASTIRRDLSTLQRQGRIARTYGGALPRDVFHERSFNESERLNREAKSAIASLAADLVPPEATVFIDAGTTCLALAQRLAERGPLSVVTRGLEAALLLSRAPSIEVVMVGGRVQPLSHGVTGPLSSMTLERFHFDLAFIGADAVDPIRGVGEPTVEETWVKERAALAADQVVLLADASKLTQTAPAWTPIEAGWCVVMDASVPDEALGQWRERGVRVLTGGAADEVQPGTNQR